MKLSEAINLFGIFKNLNGYKHSTTENGQNVVVTLPYKFDAKTCWNISRNLNTLREHVTDYDSTVKQLATSLGIQEGKTAETAVFQDYLKQVNTLLEQEVVLKHVIHRFNLKDLNLDVNPIPPGVLAELADYIDEK